MDHKPFKGHLVLKEPGLNTLPNSIQRRAAAESVLVGLSEEPSIYPSLAWNCSKKLLHIPGELLDEEALKKLSPLPT